MWRHDATPTRIEKTLEIFQKKRAGNKLKQYHISGRCITNNSNELGELLSPICSFLIPYAEKDKSAQKGTILKSHITAHAHMHPFTHLLSHLTASP